MLIVSRKTFQRVRLRTPQGQDIWVTLVDVDRGKVRIGFEADRDIEILREELIQSRAAESAP